jgi:hypothetical protein
MKDIRSLHSEAMDLAESASLAGIRNDPEAATRLLRRAYELEREAASLCSSDLGLEPTRSVLHRSAASLAIDCGEYREAERLIATALSGEPPAEITEELRDLLEQVYFHIHVPPRLNISIDERDAQFLKVHGKLKFADSTGGAVGTIKLVENSGEEHVVNVPEGMMSDIVRPLWGSYVSVIGTRTESGILLEDIKRLSS